MPELPSVETFKQYFDSTSLNQNIEKVVVNNPEILIETTKKDIKNSIESEFFVSSSRYGKYLFVSVSNKCLLAFHFGMTGFFKYNSLKKGQPPHSRISFIFKNGNTLNFEDPRKFGKLSLIENINNFIEKKKLGPDALEINQKKFIKIFKGRKGYIKPLLMNQKFLAGIGNLYADEILYQSGIHPLKTANRLKMEDLVVLYNNMHMVLQKAIKIKDMMLDFPENFLLPHRYPGGKCPEYGKLDIIKVGGRTTYYCPEKQILDD
jgi:formamidopyrimidine-DNA glycosylase